MRSIIILALIIQSINGRFSPFGALKNSFGSMKDAAKSRKCLVYKEAEDDQIGRFLKLEPLTYCLKKCPPRHLHLFCCPPQAPLDIVQFFKITGDTQAKTAWRDAECTDFSSCSSLNSLVRHSWFW